MDHDMDHDESALMAALASLDARITRFVVGSLDRDAAHPQAGHELGRDLVILGRAVQRHTRVRAASWGHSCLEPDLGHVRATENGVTTVSMVDGAAVGPAVCGAWLVADLPLPETWDVAVCPACLTALGQMPELSVAGGSMRTCVAGTS